MTTYISFDNLNHLKNILMTVLTLRCDDNTNDTADIIEIGEFSGNGLDFSAFAFSVVKRQRMTGICGLFILTFVQSTSKVKAGQLWPKSKDELVKQLAELKTELGQLRIQKITSSGSKLNRMYVRFPDAFFLH